MIWDNVVIIMAALFLLEGMVILTLPKKTTKLVKKLMKDQNRFKFIGMVEALVGLILLILVLVY